MKGFLMAAAGLLTAVCAVAQVQYNPGPALENDRDVKVNRMLAGDDNSFYCFRIRSRGRGTSYVVEKYDNKKLQPIFSKEVNLEGDDNKSRIEDVMYAQNNVYIFRRKYDKSAEKMTLYYQQVSSTGQVTDKLTPIVSVSADHYEFVDFDIFQNPAKSKFLVKLSHKASKDAEYSTDFIALDGKAGLAKLWTKTIDQRLSNQEQFSFNFMGFGYQSKKNFEFIGLNFDDKDNIYYCYAQEADNSNKKERTYQLYMATWMAGDAKPKALELTFDGNYRVNDIKFLKTSETEMVVAGYVKEVEERRGRDLVKVGFFSYKVNLGANAVSAKAIYFFDDKMLAALESNNKRSRYFKYKLDYILPIGDAVYYVGEQYNEQYVSSSYGSMSSRSYWRYEYMDVIVTKLNANGRFEWVKNVPLRNEMTMGLPHVFKQYIAVPTQQSLYILCDDHPKNMERYEKDNYEPSDLKSVQGIHGSNFVSNQVSLANGKIKRSVVFENESYCFAPIQERDPAFMPPSYCEIFVPGPNNQIYIYTEDRGRDQFATLKFKP